MSSRPELKLDWCSHEAAKYAVEHWHYSKQLPSGKVVRIGVWEAGKFIGCVLYARGSNQHIGKDIYLGQTTCVELVRVALCAHSTHVSRIIAISLKLLKKQSAGLRCVISFADLLHGHIGSIYQAGGWIYTGTGTNDKRCRSYLTPSGKTTHWRTVCAELGKRGQSRTVEAAASIGFIAKEWKPKHRYLMPLDIEMRSRILPLSKPYPKRAGGDTKDTAGHQPAEGGSTPTPALHSS